LTAQWTSPGQRWRLLAPEGAVAVEMSPGLRGIRRAVAELRALPGGTPVVLLDYRPGGRLRARRLAAVGAIVIDRQYVALPSLRRPIVVAEDSRDPLRWACRTVIAPPPGSTRAHALIDAAVKLLRRRPEVAGWAGPGRVVVGRTT
jgi:hypothetical protein